MQHLLTMVQVEDIMLDAARLALGVPGDDWRVRLANGAGSPTGSAPAHDYTQDVCYVAVSPHDDGYGKAHYVRYENGAAGALMTEVDEYTEEYAVTFSCYGGSAYESSRAVRDWLYGAASRRIFHGHKLHLVPGTPQLVQTHDVVNSSWVRRCDFTAVFYSYARAERPDSMDWYESANVALKTS